MTSLQWADAVAACAPARVFDVVDRVYGWPAVMKLEQLAALQRPYAKGDQIARGRYSALLSALRGACDAGAIAFEEVSEQVQVAPAQSVELQPFARNWPARYTDAHGNPRAYTRPAQYQAVTRRRIAAAALVAWLQGQGEEPSKHVFAWVAAVTPVVSVPVERAAFPLADFAALVAYRKAQKAANVAAGKPRKNTPWTDGNQLDLLHAEYGQRGRNSSASEAMAQALGISRQAVDSALRLKRKRAPASPFGQLGERDAA